MFPKLAALQRSLEPNWTEPRVAPAHYLQNQNNPGVDNCFTRLSEVTWIVFHVSASQMLTELFSLELLIEDSIVRFRDMSSFSII